MVYRENMGNDYEALFANKEVLVKVITFDSGQAVGRREAGTNRRDIAHDKSANCGYRPDHRSNEVKFMELQNRMFECAGLFLERKRGEFEDGKREGYIDKHDIVDRNLFFRAAFAAQGRVQDGSQKRLVVRADYSGVGDVDGDMLNRYAFAYTLLNAVAHKHTSHSVRIGVLLLARVCLATAIWYKPGMTRQQWFEAAMAASKVEVTQWDQFLAFTKNSTAEESCNQMMNTAPSRSGRRSGFPGFKIT